MWRNIRVGSTSGSGEACSSANVNDVAFSRKLTEKGSELVIHAISQEIGPISDDLLSKVKEIFLSTMEKIFVHCNQMRDTREMMQTRNVRQAMLPIIKDWLPRVIEEEIPSAVKKFMISSNRNIQDELAPSTERIFELMFLVEVSREVLTGKEIKGKDGMHIKLALVDKTTGEVVENGPGASAKVEIVVLESSLDDNEQSYSLEDFNNRIITESDKTKPHFTKRNYLYLKAGVVYLHDVKLGHSSKWMTSCWCRLGARIVNNDSGVKVKEAWTKPFEVKDRRSYLYEKHHPPRLSDEVWRLDNIHKTGERRKRLNEKKVETVQDFLFFHRIDPDGLKKLVGARGENWKAILNHAETCIIDDNKIYFYPSSAERVAFDAVGELKGMISDSYFVPINDLSEDKKATARELLRLVFRNREGGMESFDDEASLLNQFPCISSGITNAAATYCPTLDVPSGCDLTISRSIIGYDPTESSISSQRPVSFLYPNELGYLGSTNMDHPYEQYFGDANEGPSWQFSELSTLDCFGDYEDRMSSFHYEETNIPETLNTRSRFRLKRATVFMLWFFRARKRVKASEDFPCPKRQRSC